MWDNGLGLFASSPLFGIGFGNWIGPMVAHNSLIQCAGQLGMFGLIPWVMLIFLALKNCFYMAFLDNDGSLYGVRKRSENTFYALLAYVCATVFFSAVTTDLLFIIVGLASAITNVFLQKREEHFELLGKRDLVYGIMLSLGGLAGFKIFVLIAT